MEYIFFCIYNTQYLDGNNKVNKTPWFDALGIMIAGSCCWLGIIFELFYFYLLNQNFPSVSIAGIVIISFLLSYLHYFMFIKDKKYEKIYKHYKSKNAISSKTAKWVSISYVLIPGIISMLIAMKWHKII